MAGLSDGKIRSSFTPTQTKMLELLKDGMPHDKNELHACLRDELQSVRNIHNHLNLIRRVIRPLGQDILLELFDGLPHYRWVVLLTECKCRKVLI